MEGNKELQDNAAEIKDASLKKQDVEELKRQLEANLKERRERRRVANEAMMEGKGRLELEKPILARDEEITELPYDFTEITGLEYTEAMDKDPNASQIYRITYKQALVLFAIAAAKQSDNLDYQDIVERIGMTDALEGVQLATHFFIAATRAGQMRISKR